MPVPDTEKPKALLFGREPAFWVGLIEAGLAVLLSWNITGLSADQIGGIMAVVVAFAGLYTAYVTKDTMLGMVVGLAKATFILLATFQINLTENQTTTAIALITVLAGAYNRTQTGVAIHPTLKRDEAGRGTVELIAMVAVVILAFLGVLWLLNH